jgi:hypothetical protein
MYARLFLPAWSRGNGGVQLDDFTWCMGAWPPPHPSIGSRTRATIRQYNVQFLTIILNLNVKIDFQSKTLPHTWPVQTSNQILTLIRTAGVVYDFQYFEDVELSNG